jgi:hypothetical protein
MLSPQIDHSSGDDATQMTRSNISGDNSGFRAPSHLPVTYQPPRVATNRNGQIPIAEPCQQEDLAQYLPYTPLQTSAVPQGQLSPDDAADIRRASDLSERTLYDQTEENMQRSVKRVSLSYQHPNDIVNSLLVTVTKSPIVTRMIHSPMTSALASLGTPA